MYIYLFHLGSILKRSHTLHPCQFTKSLLFLLEEGSRKVKKAIALPLYNVVLLGCLTVFLWSTVPPLAESASLLIADSASSQEFQPEATSQPQSAEDRRLSPRGSADISSETLNRFVTAYRQVLNLVEKRADELHRAETESTLLRMQRDLENEAIAIIENTGLTWQEYLQLLSLANSDAELSERIVTQLQELGASEENDD